MFQVILHKIKSCAYCLLFLFSFFHSHQSYSKWFPASPFIQFYFDIYWYDVIRKTILPRPFSRSPNLLPTICSLKISWNNYGTPNFASCKFATKCVHCRISYIFCCPLSAWFDLLYFFCVVSHSQPALCIFQQFSRRNWECHVKILKLFVIMLTFWMSALSAEFTMFSHIFSRI